jgi:hypothetical protein
MTPVFAIETVGTVTLIAVVLIVLALVVYLAGVILQLLAITRGLDQVIEHVGGIIQKSEPVNGIVDAINAQLDAGVDLLEGLLVKKAGLTDAVGLVEGLYPGSAAAGLRNFPESTEITAPRIGEVYTQGTLTLARLGREAPIAAGNPAGPALRDVVRASLSARVLYPEVRQERPERMPRSPVIGAGSPVVYPPSEQRGGTTPGAAEVAEKGPWTETAAEGIVPAELGGSDAPRTMLADDPQLGSEVLGETTGDESTAVDPAAGDRADATTDGAPEVPEGTEPDLKDAPHEADQS